MKLADIGLRPLDLGARVFFTHRASSVKVGGKGETRYSVEPRDVSRADYWRRYHDKPGPYAERYRHPACGWPAPTRRARRMDRWVVVWPEQGTGWVVGLTYRSEGVIERYHHEDGGNEFRERDRFPLYQVRSHLNGATMLVPPFACVPLDNDKVSTFGNDIPIVFTAGDAPRWFSTEDERRPEWEDYVEYKLATLARRTKVPA